MSQVLNAVMNIMATTPMPTNLLPVKGSESIKNKKIQMLLANERINSWRAVHIRRSDKSKAAQD